MTDAPKNLERIEQGGSHGFDITWLTRAKEFGGVPVYPDGYSASNPAASSPAAIMVYDALSGDPDDPANWAVPDPGLNPPVITSVQDGGSTGRVIANTTADPASIDSTTLLGTMNLRWGIQWGATTINGVIVGPFFEFITVLPAGSASFQDDAYCTAEDVSLLLEEPVPGKNHDLGGPSLTQWNRFIEWATGTVERHTRRSWRTQVHEQYADLKDGCPTTIHLQRFPVQALNAAAGDELDVYNGRSTEDYLATKTLGRNEDYWLNEVEGRLVLNVATRDRLPDAVHVKYRYGYASVHPTITEATALLAASRVILASAGYAGHGSGDDDTMPMGIRAATFRKRAFDLLDEWMREVTA